MSQERRTVASGIRMDDLPRQTLINLIQEYGRSLCDDPQRCSGLLKDFCGIHRREVHALVESIKERVPAELTAAPASIPHSVTISRLAARLQDNLGLSETVAQWAVESWAIALGIVTAQEITDSEVPRVEDDVLLVMPEDLEPTLDVIETETIEQPPTQFDHPTEYQPQPIKSTTPAMSERDSALEQVRRHLDADRLREGIDLLSDALRRFADDKEIQFLLGEARNKSRELMMLAAREERWFRAKRFLLLCKMEAPADTRDHIEQMVARARRFGQFFLLALLGFFPWVISAYPTYGYDGFRFSGQLAIAVLILPFGALAISGRAVFDSSGRMLIIGMFAIVVTFVLEQLLGGTKAEFIVRIVFGVLAGCVLADLARRLLPRDDDPSTRLSDGLPVSGLSAGTPRPVGPPAHPGQSQGVPVRSSRPPPHPSQRQPPGALGNPGAPVRRRRPVMSGPSTDTRNNLVARFLGEVVWINSHYFPGAVAGGIAALVLGVLGSLGPQVTEGFIDNELVFSSNTGRQVEYLVVPAIIIFGLLASSGLVRRWTSFLWIPFSTTIVVCILTFTGFVAENPKLSLALGSMFIALSVLMAAFQKTTGKEPLGIMLSGLASAGLALIGHGILPEDGRFVPVYIGVWFAVWGTLSIRSRSQLLPCLQVIDRFELWQADQGVSGSRRGPGENSPSRL